MSYGSHTNDVLWTECKSIGRRCGSELKAKGIDGFILEENSWDALNLDAFVLAPQTGIGVLKIAKRLESSGFFGCVLPLTWSPLVADEREATTASTPKDHAGGHKLLSERKRWA